MKNSVESLHQPFAMLYASLLSYLRSIALSIAILITLPIFSANAQQVGDKDFTLKCEFTRYGNSGAATKLTKGWIPPNQTHQITGNEVVFKSYYKKLRGKITKRNDERIEWSYQERAKDKKGRRFGATRYYSYFFTTNKIASKMGFKVYRDFEHVWGTCKPTAEKTATISNKSRPAKTAKPSKKWTYLRGNTDISIYHNAKLDFYIVTSTNPFFYKLYARLLKAPETRVGVAMHWQDNDKSVGYNNYIYQYPDFIGTTAFEKKQALILRGKILDQLKNEKKPFLEFAITDMETDIYFAEHTTTEYRE